MSLTNATAGGKTFALSMATSGDKIYIGMTEHTFRTRYNNHKLSFKHRKHSHDTVLSKYIWDQKNNGISNTIK